MTIEEVKSLLAKSFGDVGVMIDYDNEGDIDIRDDIGDSLQFITAVLQIESNFDIVLSDELMLYESLASFNAFAESIYSLWKEKHDAEKKESPNANEDVKEEAVNEKN